MLRLAWVVTCEECEAQVVLESVTDEGAEEEAQDEHGFFPPDSKYGHRWLCGLCWRQPGWFPGAVPVGPEGRRQAYRRAPERGHPLACRRRKR